MFYQLSMSALREHIEIFCVCLLQPISECVLNVLPCLFISRHYFALQTNPGEQFYMFTTLSSWLIKLAGKPFDTPQEVSYQGIVFFDPFE